jgi:hypothetical protein
VRACVVSAEKGEGERKRGRDCYRLRSTRCARAGGGWERRHHTEQNGALTSAAARRSKYRFLMSSASFSSTLLAS